MTNENIGQDIELGLKLYLKQEHNVDALTARLGEVEYEERYGGCHTCGYGESGGYMSFDIYYTTANSTNGWGNLVTVNGDPLGFFPTLLQYIERARQ